jgi:8-oxo-dGTP pyrophosphatase MutT (NUDIX family)
MISKWKTIEKELVGNFRIFTLNLIKREHPVTHKISTFTGLEADNWVNIIPITKSKEVILVEQYRHGTDDITIEIPAGIIEKDEEPVDAAMRECCEETGYFSDNKPILLGRVRPNPAFLNNYCYHYLWEDVEQKFEQDLDDNEDINFFKVPLNEIALMISEEKMVHSLIMSAFYFYKCWVENSNK